MKIKRYFASLGSRITDDDAEILGKEIEKLGSEFAPADLVAAAREKTSSIHDYFEWDDKIAGELYRVEQAGEYIRHVHIEFIGRGKIAGEMRAFQSVVVSDGDDSLRRVYKPVTEIVKHKDLREQVVARAYRELVSWRERWVQYRNVFGDVFEAIDELQPVV